MRPIAPIAVSLMCSLLVCADTISIGTNNVAVVFADENLSETAAGIICTDISRYLSLFDAPEKVFKTTAPVDNYKCYLSPKAVGCFSSPALGQVWYQTNSSPCIHIERGLSDYYLGQLQLISNYTSILQEADSFVGSLVDGSFTNQPLAYKTSAYASNPSSPNQPSSQERLDFIEQCIISQKCAYPCIMKFAVAEPWEGSNPVPTMTFRVLERSNPSALPEEYCIIYYDGRWRILGIE